MRPFRDRAHDDPGRELPSLRADRARRGRPQPPAPGHPLTQGAAPTGFRKLWAGETVSQLGSAVTQFALPTAAVLQLHAGAFEVGVLLALNKVAFPVLGLPVGVWIDRLPRRPVMIAADLGRALALGTIPLAAATGHLSLPLLYAVATVTGVLTLFFDVAYLAYLPDLVGKTALSTANSRLQVSGSVAGIAGPSLAGLLAQAAGAAQAITANAASYLVSALAIAWIREPETRLQRAQAGMVREVREGLAFVFGDPYLTSLITLIAGYALAGHVAMDILPVFVYRQLKLSPALFGLAIAAEGLAAVGGALLAGWAARRFGVGPAIGWTGGMAGLAMAFLPASLFLPAFPVLVVALATVALTNTIQDVNQLTLRQHLTPDHLQGRMTATFRTIFWGAQPLGSFLGGWLGAHFGLPQTMLAGGLVSAAFSLAVMATPLGRLRAADL